MKAMHKLCLDLQVIHWTFSAGNFAASLFPGSEDSLLLCAGALSLCKEKMLLMMLAH